MTDTIEAPALSTPRLAAYNSRRLGFTAGVVAATVMLVAIVVLRALSGVTSLPEVVAEGLLVVMPGALFSAVLDALQHAAKPLFYLAIVIGMLVVGGLLGRVYGENPTWRQAAKIVLITWLVFGLGVYTVLGAGLFGQHLGAGPIWHGLTLLLVFAVYGVALAEAHAVLTRRVLPDAQAPLASRRALLQSAGVATIAVVATGGAWRLMSGPLRPAEGAVKPQAAGAVPAAGEPNSPPVDLKGLSPELTPTGDVYPVS